MISNKRINADGGDALFSSGAHRPPLVMLGGGFTISNIEGNGWAGSEKTKFGLRVKGKSFASS